MTPLMNLGALPASVRHSEQRAFITPMDDQQERDISYAQLDAYADAIGRGLRQRGLEAGTRIAILGRNSIDFIASLLGIMRAGLVAVPINYKFPAETIEHILADSDSQLLLGDGKQLERIGAHIPRLDFEHQLSAFISPGELPLWQPEPETLALLLYTSGSTGVPKGVRLTHASHRWVVETRLAGRELEGERVLIAAPLYHMNALALALLTLASGVTSVLLPQFNARDYINAITRFRCTWLTAVPPMIAMMLQEKALLAERDLSSVRVVRMGSAPVNDALYAAIHQLLPSARIINAYGTTEGGPVVFAAHPQAVPTPPQSLGYPHPQVDIRLRNRQGALDSQGVLELRSPALMQGYHQRPDLPSPFTEDGFYHTGDVFRRDSAGFYYFIGRHDDMFVSGGENIYPGEVEHLIERHPAVQQACVVPVNDDIKGTKPVAWVILKPGANATPQELKEWTLRHGPAYLHPRHIWLLELFPLASTNKVDRRALRADAEQRLHLIHHDGE